MTDPKMTEHEAATADVLADATAALANEAMRHIAKICGERTNLMLAISTIVTHRFEMLYRTEFMKAIDAANKPKQEEMKYEQVLMEQ